MYITLAPKPKKKPTKTVRGIIFENKDVQFIDISCILHDP